MFEIYSDKPCVTIFTARYYDRVVSVEYALRDDDVLDLVATALQEEGMMGDVVIVHRGVLPSPAYRSRPIFYDGHLRSQVYDRYDDYGKNRSPEFGRYRTQNSGDIEGKNLWQGSECLFSFIFAM